jgi:hypothetical protein
VDRNLDENGVSALSSDERSYVLLAGDLGKFESSESFTGLALLTLLTSSADS